MDIENINELRKSEHLKCFLDSRSENDNRFDDIIIQNNSIPEIDFEDINIRSEFLGKEVSAPIIINAITGGTDAAKKINEQLSILAKKYNIPIAVGSQSVGLKNKDKIKSYSIVRDTNDTGIVISNLSALKPIEDMKRAIEMIEADAIQLHINVPQEICMTEGDRNFKGIYENIRKAVQEISIPIIVKEVGFGISKDIAQKLYDIGVRYVDIGGKGGTNFIEIEDMRNREMDYRELYTWGIPTASSLLQSKSVNSDIHIICSGGIKKAEEVVKALIIGADMVGITGVVLRELLENGLDAADNFIKDMIHKIKVFMLLLGCNNIHELRSVPYILKDELKIIADYYGI